MNVRLLLASLLFSLVCTPVFAQTFRPLAGYEALAAPAKKAAGSVEKMADCNGFVTDGFALVAPGATLVRRIFPDTIGLGDDLTIFTCDGCADARFGTATYANDTLIYGANAGAELGVDTLRLSLCNAAGLCSDAQTIVVLVRRAGQEISLPVVTIRAREEVVLPVPLGNLPGGTTCRTLERCTETYAGRSQRIGFVNRNLNSDNNITYESSGVGGIDEVCVTLCNDFGICDTYRARVNITVTAVELPFFDDFTYDGVRPDPLLWQDEDVLINRNFPQLPPSIGVATFDGVDFGGQAYPAGSGGRITVVRDYLTSAPVNAAGATGTNLSFFLQPRGFGNRPETQDSFIVQFLTAGGDWRSVYARAGELSTIPGNVPIPFEGVLIPLADEYLYNGFQFRFASRSSEQGAVDMWHLDYVKMGPGLTLNSTDVALVDLPGYLLKSPFTSIPVRHLQEEGESLLNDSLVVRLRNLDANAIQTINSDNSTLRILLNNRGFQAFQSFTTAFDNISGSNSNDIPADTLVSQAIPLTKIDAEQLVNVTSYLFETLEPDDVAKPVISYELNINGEDSSFDDGAFIENNSAIRTTCLDNYMAYDDGTAELTIEGQQGTTILQRYRAFVADELTGIQIRIPRGLGGLGDQDIRLVVYTGEAQPEELLAEYDFEVLYAENFFTDSLEGYTTYIFPDVVDLPVGNFYVGWQQQRANRDIGVGYDRNTPPPAGEGYQWFNTGGGWNELTGTLTGAIMIRPLLSGFEGFTTRTDEEPVADDALVDVYPNPTNGTLHLRPRQMRNANDLTYKLYALTGALLSENRLGTTLELGHLPAGIYLLEVTDGQVRSRHKVVRR
jgi:hypothetical protein